MAKKPDLPEGFAEACEDGAFEKAWDLKETGRPIIPVLPKTNEKGQIGAVLMGGPCEACGGISSGKCWYFNLKNGFLKCIFCSHRVTDLPPIAAAKKKKVTFKVKEDS